MLLHKTLIAYFGVIFFCSSAFAERCENEVATLLSFEGDVSVQWSSTDSWQKAKVGDGFCYGDILQVTYLRAVISLENDTLVKLNQGSTIKFLPPDESFWVELIEGAARFISRTPKNFKVKAPYLNAAVEGTEFVVEHTPERGIVTVFDGRVVAFNDAGKTTLNELEQSESFKGEAPTPALRIQLVGLATWTHYIPPVYVPTNTSTPAAKLFERGRLRESFERANQDGEADLAAVLAHFYGQENAGEQSQAQLSQDILNRIEIFKLLEKGDVASARAINNTWLWKTKSVNALVVNSYIFQAEKQLENAFAAIKQAGQISNSIWVKLRAAELAIMLGKSQQVAAYLNLRGAEAAALSYGATLKALVSIQKNSYTEAEKLLEQAIAADSNYPMSHMLLGMVKIRQGDLVSGRSLLEQAAMLDPNNSLLRSYLGQSYAEERRWNESVDELEIATRLDAEDPTPWYFLAFGSLDRSEYLSARRQFERSIELNDARAIYRSNELVESDVSARLTQLGMLYRKLGLTESSKRISMEMLQKDRLDYFGHLLQVGASANEEGQASATATSRLLATINQPLGATYLPIDLMGKPLNIQSSATPINTGLHEYSNLFRSKDISGNISLMRSGRGGDVDDLSAQIISGQMAIDVARYTYDTEGYRENNDASYEVASSMLHWQPTDSVSLQYEMGEIDGEFGDLFSPLTVGDFNSNQRSTRLDKLQRLSAVVKPNRSHKLLFNTLQRKRDFSLDDLFVYNFSGQDYELDLAYESEIESGQLDVQYEYIISRYATARFGLMQGDLESSGVDSFAGVVSNNGDDLERKNAFAEGTFGVSDFICLHFGTTYEEFAWSNFGPGGEAKWNNQKRLLPKVGAGWSVNDELYVRAAYGELLASSPDALISLEGTNLMGFEMSLGFDAGTMAEVYAVAIDAGYHNNLRLHLSAEQFDITTVQPLSTVSRNKFEEFPLEKRSNKILLEYQPTNNFSISAELNEGQIENKTEGFYRSSLPLWLDTSEVMFKLSLFLLPNFEIHADYSYVDQKLSFVSVDDVLTDVRSANILDVSLGAYFYEKHGRFDISVHNVLDEEYIYNGDELFTFNQIFSSGAPMKVVSARISFMF